MRLASQKESPGHCRLLGLQDKGLQSWRPGNHSGQEKAAAWPTGAVVRRGGWLDIGNAVKTAKIMGLEI